jgi:hypothetical protein
VLCASDPTTDIITQNGLEILKNMKSSYFSKFRDIIGSAFPIKNDEYNNHIETMYACLDEQISYYKHEVIYTRKILKQTYIPSKIGLDTTEYNEKFQPTFIYLQKMLEKYTDCILVKTVLEEIVFYVKYRDYALPDDDDDAPKKHNIDIIDTHVLSIV